MEFVRFAENLATFVDVARAGSFSAVARRKGQVASSVARQIDALEREMGVALFTRSTRALVRTEAGDLLFERATRILQELNETRDAVTALEQGVSGRLRVACLPAFARRHVVPHLGSLYAQYPGLTVELELTDRVVDPVLERFDVVIRVGQQADSSLIARRIASQRYIVCATPAYLQAHGRPLHAEELAHHRLIDRAHSTSMRGWREVLRPAHAASAAFAMECDDCDARRLSVLQGLGIALMPDWSVGEDIGAGRLVELLLEGVLPQAQGGIHLVRAAPRPPAKLKAFSAHLLQSIGSPPRWQVAMTRAGGPAGRDAA
ncbi:Transcriptional regulator, LysR-family [Cupriavidus necator]|uniref:LysR family transcriptional regulator n=2 Tax=Cupriavidus necator TaxID=106590 RepID=Q0KAS3_CUPNH|nr:LysR family transcriptional regulator [Cupriavidus necator]QCC00757.1 LysR family transcriptional regulator [Cupriavidus necator H16]QQB76419.1 LysR family transcriptional regulator [Cupriavidus necator]WKA42640.1 LysR substrate-binding domain-containing protein [Cupriavidus necator]CAJ92898.1 transcriptional regulator, LysR-family [Cupriavidus necator H16]